MTETEWVPLTEHTPDPKLGWIERKLAEMGIPSRRGGSSAHFQVLEIPRQHLAQALEWMQSSFEEQESPGDRTDVHEYEPHFGGDARAGDDDEEQ